MARRGSIRRTSYAMRHPVSYGLAALLLYLAGFVLLAAGLTLAVIGVALVGICRLIGLGAGALGRRIDRRRQVDALQAAEQSGLPVWRGHDTQLLDSL